jgi:IS4 transposase
LLWRATEPRLLPVEQLLPDGSYLSRIEPTGVGKAAAAAQALQVRVIEYQLPGVPDAAPRYRLMTSLLDPFQAPALELAALYHQRWQVEAVFDELKTHLRQSRRVLRSKTAELVRQEFYGWVLAHYAVRWLLHEGAARSGQADEALSFTAHVQLLRRELPRSGAFPPSAAQAPAAMVP